MHRNGDSTDVRRSANAFGSWRNSSRMGSEVHPPNAGRTLFTNDAYHAAEIVALTSIRLSTNILIHKWVEVFALAVRLGLFSWGDGNGGGGGSFHRRTDVRSIGSDNILVKKVSKKFRIFFLGKIMSKIVSTSDYVSFLTHNRSSDLIPQ